MSDRRRKVRGTLAASILLAASLATAPAIAKRPPPPPPPPTDPDPWAGCTPWGPVIYGVDCCDYPELVIPCAASQSQPADRLRLESAESSEG